MRDSVNLLRFYKNFKIKKRKEDRVTLGNDDDGDSTLYAEVHRVSTASPAAAATVIYNRNTEDVQMSIDHATYLDMGAVYSTNNEEEECYSTINRDAGAGDTYSTLHELPVNNAGDTYSTISKKITTSQDNYNTLGDTKRNGSIYNDGDVYNKLNR